MPCILRYFGIRKNHKLLELQHNFERNDRDSRKSFLDVIEEAGENQLAGSRTPRVGQLA